jgi:Domain of unknown function (DUF4404)
MSSEQLNSLLQRLHEELARTSTFDGESRRLLDIVVSDIEKLGGAVPATPGGLESLAVRFEADHPAVAAALRQVGDLLGKAGI